VDRTRNIYEISAKNVKGRDIFGGLSMLILINNNKR
jgi:hypothetical protein